MWKLLFYVSLLVVPLLAASLWLDTHGETVTGTVTAKREEIHAENEPTGGWSSRRFLEVDVPRLAAVGVRASVRVDSARYAAIDRGDSVRVRYLSCCPIFARLEGRTTREVSWEAAREFASSPMLDWVLVGIVALVVAARIATPIVVATGVAWLAAGFLFLFPDRMPRVPMWFRRGRGRRRVASRARRHRHTTRSWPTAWAPVGSRAWPFRPAPPALQGGAPHHSHAAASWPLGPRHPSLAVPEEPTVRRSGTPPRRDPVSQPAPQRRRLPHVQQSAPSLKRPRPEPRDRRSEHRSASGGQTNQAPGWHPRSVRPRPAAPRQSGEHCRSRGRSRAARGHRRASGLSRLDSPRDARGCR